MRDWTDVLSRVAAVASASANQTGFRTALIELLAEVVPSEFTVLQLPPSVRDTACALFRGVDASARAGFARRWPGIWPALRPGIRSSDVPVEVLDARAAALLGAALGQDSLEDVCALRLGRDSASAVLLLGRRTGRFDEAELRFLRLAAPVIRLGDERSVGLSEVVGAALTRREREIFDYLCRGYRNEDIALALGTSPFTVRNQLVKLYRKTGVCTRSELVGRASTLMRRWAAGTA